MRDHLSTLRYTAAALALCCGTLAALSYRAVVRTDVRASEEKRAAEQAASDAIRDSQRQQECLDAVLRELETLDRAVQRARQAFIVANHRDRTARGDDLIEAELQRERARERERWKPRCNPKKNSNFYELALVMQSRDGE